MKDNFWLGSSVLVFSQLPPTFPSPGANFRSPSTIWSIIAASQEAKLQCTWRLMSLSGTQLDSSSELIMEIFHPSCARWGERPLGTQGESSRFVEGAYQAICMLISLKPTLHIMLSSVTFVVSIVNVQAPVGQRVLKILFRIYLSV